MSSHGPGARGQGTHAKRARGHRTDHTSAARARLETELMHVISEVDDDGLRVLLLIARELRDRRESRPLRAS